MSLTTIDPKLGEYLPIESFARMVHKSRRTITRWISQPDGLPHLRLGNETHIPLADARGWLASRIKRPNPRRRVG
jgi:hypothetical protein